MGRLIRTLRYLKASQIFARLLYRIRPIRYRAGFKAALRSAASDWTASIEKPGSLAGEQTFQLLNQEIVIQAPEDWNNRAVDKLLLYHLHYFDDLNSESSVQRRDAHERLIQRWIDENPVLHGNGWEAYPLSLRIVNWIKWRLSGNRLSPKAIDSLYLQARVLSQRIEYHLLANHLLANAKALIFAGCVFDGEEAETWKQVGEDILRSQLSEQILGDGGHFELSPMYHAIVLEDVLDLINLSRAYGGGFEHELKDVAEKMLHWLCIMTPPDGQPAYFNDSTIGVAPLRSSLKDYAMRLGLSVLSEPAQGITSLGESGYVRFDNDLFVALIDVGRIGPDYQPGHGHCDCLSFELSYRGKRSIVNSGVSTYNKCDLRTLERSTAAHNTVSIDGTEQSEIWSAFRVGRRAKPFDVRVYDHGVSASHDGYSRQAITHSREFQFDGNVIEIIDSLTSNDESSRRGHAHFHFHPDIAIEFHDDHVIFGDLRLEFASHEAIRSSQYEYCLGFSKTRTAKAVHVDFNGHLTSKISHANSVHH